MDFNQKLNKAVSGVSSTLFTGIDPNPDLFPNEIKNSGKPVDVQTKLFCEKVIKLTAPYSCGFKFNVAFFEALGSQGWQILEELTASVSSDKIILADAKRGDIGNTAKMYAKAFFEVLNVDSVTINPLMGADSVSPWLDYPDKAVFVLGLTSNPGSEDFFLQKTNQSDTYLFEVIANSMKELQQENATTIGLVAGATQKNRLKLLSKQFVNAPLLMPGIGAQGGGIPEILKTLEDHRGILLPAISRAIIYASDGDDWMEKMVESASNYKNELQPYVQNLK